MCTLCTKVPCSINEDFFILEAGCRTPRGESGDCINLRQCQPLLDLLHESGSQRQTHLDYLVKSQCGFEGRDPLVCCPIDVRPVTNRYDQPNVGDQQFNLRNNVLLPTDCGNDLTSRIIGGEITELDEFPWMTLLEYQKREFERQGFFFTLFFVYF